MAVTGIAVQRKLHDWLRIPGQICLATLPGVVAFMLVCSWAILNTDYDGWLSRGDVAQHFLSWSYFRAAPWSAPPGANPHYGLEISSSILYSDSIPIFAFLFKFLREVYGVRQYFGLWILVCFVLQSVFAWKLLGLCSKDSLFRLAGAFMFCFAPPFLWRFFGGHFALAGQWLVLAALWAALAPPRPLRSPLLWGTLIGTSALVHPYLLAMVCALWFADAARRVVMASGRARDQLVKILVEAVTLLALLAVLLWAAGFFALAQGFGPGDYGRYALDLLDPVNSKSGVSWSYLLPGLPRSPLRAAGSNYLGLGLILVAAVALVALMSRPSLAKPRPDQIPLCVAMIGLAAFAVSPQIEMGGVTLLDMPIPDRLNRAASVFRASERMFWPVFYFIALLAVCLVVRRWGGRNAAWLLTVAAFAQAADTHAGWRVVHNWFAGGEMWQPLAGPFWNEAARTYQRVRVVPLANHAEGWSTIARYAASNQLPTDAVYLARLDANALTTASARSMSEITEGRFDPKTLYVLNTPGVVDAAAARLDPDADLLIELDGLRVLAPGWKRFHAVPPSARELSRNP